MVGARPIPLQFVHKPLSLRVVGILIPDGSTVGRGVTRGRYVEIAVPIPVPMKRKPVLTLWSDDGEAKRFWRADPHELPDATLPPISVQRV